VETVLILLEIVALACLAVVSVYLILTLIRMKRVMTSLERDLKAFADRAIPVLENIEEITTKFKNVAAVIEQEVGAIKESMAAIQQIAENVVNFERRVQERIEIPVMEAVSVVSAVFKGVRTFLDQLRA
jgi:uncharacterized protein YoxC